jgi:hypothetical protein
MKMLAIIDLAPGADPGALKPSLVEEVEHSWALHASGVLREAYATAEATRVVFVLESADRAEAEAVLGGFPLVARGLLRFELVELRPFLGWRLLPPQR